MKKRLTILALLVFVTATVHSQQKNTKSVFGVNAGLSVATDEFALSSFRYDAGFATTGPSMEIEYLWYGKIIGFSSSIGYSSIFFNERGYISEYDRVLGGYGTNDVSAGNYQVLKFLVGFTLKIPEINHTEVMILLHLGVAGSIHPHVTVTNSQLGEINSIVRSSEASPVSNATLKINHWLNDKYGITLNTGVNSTRPSFRDETGIGGSFFLSIHYVNINAGLVIRLNRPAQ
ncbi:MAG: hypothetical protein MUE37_14060 [Bacteroidales bacterium]|jgi:hypothetical protein|nr:hypothetical protein [Bacteroidales bacterium]